MLRRIPPLEENALSLIRTKRLNTASLALALGVSWRTAARAVQRLRGRGVRILTIREGRSVHYQPVNGAPSRGGDPLLSCSGFIGIDIRDGAERLDRHLYGRRGQGRTPR